MGRTPAGNSGGAHCGCAECPYYVGASYKECTITCEGFIDGTDQRMIFRRDKTRKRWDEYMLRYCCRDWRACIVASELNRLYDAGLKGD